MNIMDYIVEKALILIPVMLIIGQMLKTIPRFPDWCIPWALLVLGILGCCLMLGWSLDSGIQGILIAGAAVYGNQLWKQTRKQESGEKASASPGGSA